VAHINNISKIETAITDAHCIILAIQGSIKQIESSVIGSFCFNDKKIHPHCSQFLMDAIVEVLSQHHYSELC
jgi:hypothetical protein